MSLLLNNGDLIFKSFLELGERAHHDVVRFYKRYKQEINNLSYERRIAISFEYALALFETASYREFLNIAETLLEEIIRENIFYYKGKDVFRYILLKKGIAYFRMDEFGAARKIFTQLVRRYPEDSEVRYAFVLNERKLLHPAYISIKLAAIFSLILSFLTLLSEMLVVNPFLNAYMGHTQVFKLTTFALGLLLFAFASLDKRIKSVIHFKHIRNSAAEQQTQV